MRRGRANDTCFVSYYAIFDNGTPWRGMYCLTMLAIGTVEQLPTELHERLEAHRQALALA